MSNIDENTIEKEEILQNEESLLAGLMEAADFKNNEVQPIAIKRNGKRLFTFSVHGFSEDEAKEWRKRCTKKIPNPRGKSLPKIDGEVDYTKLRSLEIYYSTVDEDRANIWDNKKMQEALNVPNGITMIDVVLKPGEKEAICEIIDQLTGFDADVTPEEYAKN